MKVALVHDWLVSMRGGEKVLECLAEVFPEAPIYTLYALPEKLSPVLRSRKIVTSAVQRLPFATPHFRAYLPFFPTVAENFDLRGYDLIVSNSHCVAKGIVPMPDACHVSYCLTPMRYIWDQYEAYLGNASSFVKKFAGPLVASYLRQWDVTSSARVDSFLCLSRHVQERIRRYYRRDAEVIYPPVDTDYFKPSGQGNRDEGFYLIVSALVPYKRVDLAVEAFRESGKRLVVIGTGSEMERLKSKASSNIEFRGWQESAAIRDAYGSCRALIFPGEEDFGIVPLEANAMGRPVVAFRRGGVCETVVEGQSGVFFEEQTPNSLNGAVARLERKSWPAQAIRRLALRFGRERFKREMRVAILKSYKQHGKIKP